MARKRAHPAANVIDGDPQTEWRREGSQWDGRPQECKQDIGQGIHHSSPVTPERRNRSSPRANLSVVSPSTAAGQRHVPKCAAVFVCLSAFLCARVNALVAFVRMCMWGIQYGCGIRC